MIFGIKDDTTHTCIFNKFLQIYMHFMTGFVMQGHILKWFLKDHVTLKTNE